MHCLHCQFPLNLWKVFESILAHFTWILHLQLEHGTPLLFVLRIPLHTLHFLESWLVERLTMENFSKWWLLISKIFWSSIFANGNTVGLHSIQIQFFMKVLSFLCVWGTLTHDIWKGNLHTAGYFGFVKNSGITFFAVFVYTFPVAPLGSRVFALEFVFSIVQVRAVRMVPIRASVAEDSILAIYWENFVTAYAVLVNTRITSPGFIGVFFCVI